MIDIELAEKLQVLARQRPVFHSEADFQHEMAWLLRRDDSDLGIRLEHPVPGPGNGAVDMLLRQQGKVLAVELKYLCQQLTARFGDEDFALKPQGAQDIRRYDVFKDVERMERFVQMVPGAGAAVIVLSNDPAYWTGPRSLSTCDAAFALREGRVATGQLEWSEQTGVGTKRGREQPICLANSYSVAWRDYSRVSGRFGLFRSLLFTIPAQAKATEESDV